MKWAEQELSLLLIIFITFSIKNVTKYHIDIYKGKKEQITFSLLLIKNVENVCVFQIL